MNGKLIALLIRSNALMIEALKMADANAQARDGGPYHYETAEFNNLVADCELLAKEAEEHADDVQIQNQIQIAAAEGAMEGFNKIRESFPPLVPISPAHLLEPEPLKWSDVQVGRKFTGKSANNGQHYLCVITETDVHMNSAERAVNVRTKMIMIDQKEVTPFERPLPAAQFKQEFLRWIE